MAWEIYRAEVADRFAPNKNDPQLAMSNSPNLALLAKELLDGEFADDQLVSDFLFAAARFYFGSVSSAEEHALLRGGLAYLMCGYLPNDHDFVLIRAVNPALKGAQMNSKQVRDAWAFMNYKRSLHGNPNLGYTAKSGRTKRLAFRDALLRAIDYSISDLQRFKSQVHQLLPAGSDPAVPGNADAYIQRNRVDSSEIISETVPDGTIFPFGSTFMKSWTLRNTGEIPWLNRSVRRMTPNTPTYPHSAETVVVTDTMPGETVVIAVEMTVNRYPSIAIVRFKMVDAQGNLCWPNSYPHGLSVAVESRGLHWRKDS